MHMTIPSFTAAQLAAGAPGPETALTIGVLDGVHLGHQALLQRLRDEARKLALSPGVVTLHPHPITVLRPEVAPSYLTSLEDRMELIRAAGADWVVPLTFTGEVSEVESEHLAGAFYDLLRMRLMVLGPDASFGRGAPKDTVDRMRKLGAISVSKSSRSSRSCTTTNATVRQPCAARLPMETWTA